MRVLVAGGTEIISLHLVLALLRDVAQTYEWYRDRELAALGPKAWLINIARGPIVQEGALLEALRGGRIAGAILDVFEQEPLPADHPLWDFRNVVITPHVSGPSTPAEIAPIFNDNLRRYAAGRRLAHQVDRRRGY